MHKPINVKVINVNAKTALIDIEIDPTIAAIFYRNQPAMYTKAIYSRLFMAE